MDMEFKENNFTKEQWEELDKELKNWTTTWFAGIMETMQSQKPVDLYLARLGIKRYVGYENVDLRDIKLVYLTVDYIYKRQEYENLQDVNFHYLLEQVRKIKNYAEYSPDCNMFRISGTKKRWDRRFEKLEELCEMYLKSIGVWKRHN